MNWPHQADEIAQGRLVVYPTETFYALGCPATLHAAVQRVFFAKHRPMDKPLPSIVGDWAMVEKFLYPNAAMLSLAQAFWPGPLSIIMPVSSAFSPLARDGQGCAAVRMTPHPVAAGLCSAVGLPLVSSSANRSGQPPVCVPDALDPELIREADALIVADPPYPGGGKPSTLVEMIGKKKVRILRSGAVNQAALERRGYDIEQI